jgi:hypothetical protein
MTVIHAGETSLGQETKPDRCQIPSGGFFRMPKEGGEHDCTTTSTMSCTWSLVAKPRS